MATAAEDEGFQIRDSLAWLYGTGFPKSVDAASVVAKAVACTGAAATQDWAGWGTALKPGHEPIVFARKPLHGTVAANLVAHGVGALNIDACRIVSADEDQGAGRLPTNVFLDQSQGEALDVAGLPGRPSRFFWVAKPSSAERVVVDGVAHPTVKPLALMRELVRLVTPPDGVVLDPFAGSGTTVEACIIEDRRCIAIEKDPAYLPLIQQRIARQTESFPKPGTSQGSNPVSDPGLEPLTLFSVLPDAS